MYKMIRSPLTIIYLVILASKTFIEKRWNATKAFVLCSHNPATFHRYRYPGHKIAINLMRYHLL